MDHMHSLIMDDRLDVIVTTSADVVGVNFFDSCCVILTEVPTDYYDKEQVCGRAERANVLNPRRITIIVDHDKYFDEQQMNAALGVSFYPGKSEDLKQLAKGPPLEKRVLRSNTTAAHSNAKD